MASLPALPALPACPASLLSVPVPYLEAGHVGIMPTGKGDDV